MTRYSFYMTSDNCMNYVVVENRDTETWEAAILDWDVSEEEAEEAIRAFLAGEKDPYMSDDGTIWAEDKEHLLPECAKFFGFREVYADQESSRRL